MALPDPDRFDPRNATYTCALRRLTVVTAPAAVRDLLAITGLKPHLSV